MSTTLTGVGTSTIEPNATLTQVFGLGPGPAVPSNIINIPSLTTTFTPPTTCLEPTFTLTPLGSDIAHTNFSEVSRGVRTECYPSGFWLASPSASLASWYSPGICPLGYFTVEQSIDLEASIQITSATCCPSNAQYIADTTGTCVAYLSDIVIINQTGSNVATSTSTLYDPDEWEIFASPITVALESKDLSVLSTSATATPAASGIQSVPLSTASAKNTTTAGPTTSPTPSPQNSLTSAGSNLSRSAKVGIGVGAAIGGIAALLLVWILLRRKRRRSKRNDDADRFRKPELHGESVKQAAPRLDELADANVNEVDGTNKPSEMDHMNVRAELEGDWRGHEAPTD